MGLGLACLWHMLGRGCPGPSISPHWPTVCLTPEEVSVPVHDFPVTEAVSQHIHQKANAQGHSPAGLCKDPATVRTTWKTQG